MEISFTKSDLILQGDDCYKFEISLVENENIVIQSINMSSKKAFSGSFSLDKLKNDCPIFFNCKNINQAYDKILIKLERRQYFLTEFDEFIEFVINYKIDDEEATSILKLSFIDKKQKTDKNNLSSNCEILSKGERLEFRKAKEEDIETVLYFIKELALYEKSPESVIISKSVLRESIFGNEKYVQCIIVNLNNVPVGFAVYFFIFSTWVGKGLYLDDLYIQPEHRGKGIGKMLLAYLADFAFKNNCKRFEWVCLNWNQPSIEFYKSLGSVAMEEWIKFRMTGEHIQKLANDNQIFIN